jgi:hypothetical protein
MEVLKSNGRCKNYVHWLTLSAPLSSSADGVPIWH